MERKVMLLAAMALIAAGCSGIQVSQDFDPSTRFSQLKSYAWASADQPVTGNPRIDNPLRDQRIRKAVEAVLDKKGFVPTDEGLPTFLVRYQYVLQRKIESSGTSGGVGFGIGSYGRHGGIAIGTGSEVREVEEGSLIIDILDPHAANLLWRGTGSQRHRTYTDPAKAERDINRLVGEILDPFPPTGR